jgi:hypothetical protein
MLVKGTKADWYQRRDELEPNMVFTDYEGDVVRLDRRVPGDGTQWYVATASGLNWIYDNITIEPGDLREYLYTG